MKYRGVEYTLVQGIKPQVWKWRVEHKGRGVGGQQKTRADALKEAERRIDRVLKSEPRKKFVLRGPGDV